MGGKMYRETFAPLGGGVLWQITGEPDINQELMLIKEFIGEHPHKGWGLSIFDMISGSTIEISCDLHEIPNIAAYIYNLEHGTPLTFVGENMLTDSYIVGMYCTRGRIPIPSVYRAEGGELKQLWPV